MNLSPEEQALLALPSTQGASAPQEQDRPSDEYFLAQIDDILDHERWTRLHICNSIFSLFENYIGSYKSVSPTPQTAVTREELAQVLVNPWVPVPLETCKRTAYWASDLTKADALLSQFVVLRKPQGGK